MHLTITYELVGTGWAKCTVADERSRCEITASYLSDALGQLVLAAFGIMAGFKSVSFGFDVEPGEYRWIIRAIDLNEIELRVLDFDEAWGSKPDADGRQMFATRCRPLVFARAVQGAAIAVLAEHGELGYRSKWAEHAFPARQLFLLNEVLALPENKG